MKFTEHRLKDGGPIRNWLADVTVSLGCWLIELGSRYALFYEIELEEDEEQ